MQKKIRTHTKHKVPFQLIAGEEDSANGSVSFRFRDGTQENGVPIADADRAHPRSDRDASARSDRARLRRHRASRRRVVERTSRQFPTRSSACGLRTASPTCIEGKAAGDDECPFCLAPAMSDEEALIVARGKHAYVLLNLFPYNSGHLLVCPYRHVATYDEATAEEVAEIASLTQTAMRVLTETVEAARIQHRHESGSHRRRGHRRAPAPAHRAALGARLELLPDHRRDQSASSAARRRAARSQTPGRSLIRASNAVAAHRTTHTTRVES